MQAQERSSDGQVVHRIKHKRSGEGHRVQCMYAVMSNSMCFLAFLHNFDGDEECKDDRMTRWIVG